MRSLCRGGVPYFRANQLLACFPAKAAQHSSDDKNASYIALDLPLGWRENSRTETDLHLIVNYTGSDLTQNMKEALTIDVARDHSYGILVMATDHFAKFMQSACQVTANTETNAYVLGTVFGSQFPEFVQKSECAAFKKKDFGETIINRLIATPRDDFIIQWSWRYPAFKDSSNQSPPIDTMRAGIYLFSIAVCSSDTMSPTCKTAKLKIR